MHSAARTSKDLRNSSGMFAVLAFVHLYMFFYGISGLEFAIEHPRSHLFLALFMIVWAAVVASLSFWYLFLACVRVQVIDVAEGKAVARRYLAPSVTVPLPLCVAKACTTMPSLEAPYYERGTLFRSSSSFFFLPDCLAVADGIAK
jgi:hypothetical protein